MQKYDLFSFFFSFTNQDDDVIEKRFSRTGPGKPDIIYKIFKMG